jgi:hypothetical protein
MAGFEVIIYGRFWVIAEGRIRRHELNLRITSFNIFLLEFWLWDAWPGYKTIRF